MNRVLHVLLFATLLALPRHALPADDAPAQATTDDTLQEVLVDGEQPGPGLWKVTNGENTLWILGMYSPLPKGMSWRSAQVESILAQSQELLGPPDVTSNIGIFRGMRLLPSLLRARANADGAVLKDLLPPELYARWALLKQRYIGRNDKMERWRPMFAALTLYSRAQEDAGLASGNVVWPVIRKTVKKNRIKTTNPEVKIEIEDPKKLIKDFRDTSAEADIACMATLLDRVENGLDGMRQRANAWATGDIETLRRTPEGATDNVCLNVATSVPSIREKFDEAVSKARSRWVEAAERSLRTNRTTFGLLPMWSLLAADGEVEQLRALGYRVEAPQAQTGRATQLREVDSMISLR